MALPSLHLTEIPDEGLALSYEVQPEELALEPEDAQVRGVLSLSVELAKVGEAVNVTGTLSGAFVRQCVRCLKEYEDLARLPFVAEYRRNQAPPRRQHQPNRLAGLSGGGARDESEPEGLESEEVYQMTGDRLDLAGVLREQVILAIPMQPLCREDCLGLCPVCGQNRNERTCGCPEERQENPFAVLKQLQDSQPGRRFS
jgi:uncharacterized protein